MTSLLTNTAAYAALTTLKITNQDLEKSSNRVSTGLKVATASDNAAYWSIATTIRADVGSLNAVKDSIGLGLATVNAAINGLDNVRNTFLDLKSKLTAAKTPGVDRNKIQQEIAARQTDLRTYAESSTTNGEAWLATDSTSANYVKDRKIVASFSRVQGQISIGTVTVNTDETKLYDIASTTAGASGTAASGATFAAGATAALTTYNNAVSSYNAAKATYEASDHGTTATNTWTSEQGKLVTAQNTFDAAVRSANAAANLWAGGTGASAGKDGVGGILDKQWRVFGADNNGFNVGFALNVKDIDISAIQDTNIAKLNAYINLADKVLTKITDVGTKLGAIQSQIQSQSNYVDTLIKVNEKSVGILVDADMEAESTKLKALQAQQQLGIESLTIANQSTQQVLSLFRS